MVEPGERLDEDVGALVAELVPAGREEVERVVQVEVEVTVEVAAHEVVDLVLGLRVQVLRGEGERQVRRKKSVAG